MVNPAPGGGASAALPLVVNNPAPSLTSISPTSAVVGSGPITLTATGSNFTPSSVVQVNGASRSTSFVSGAQLTATLTAADLSNAGFLSITVASSGGTSAPLTFTVKNPAPSVSSVSPNPVISLLGGYTLTVNGSGFVRSSVVQVDGKSYPTTFVSPTQLKAQVSSSDLLSLGQHNVTVVNPSPGGGTSNAVTLTVASLLGNILEPAGKELGEALDLQLQSSFPELV
ncbi:MAG: hypothetical protein DMG97_36485 [Acidobacteria bacterium]|nr:MAG: hypothetical protein DMG97_36485 [Acidobacteriota bacterium]